MQHSIRIGREFFAKAKSDYSCWRWAWVREACQNGIDAPGSDEIVATVRRVGADTEVSIANNGAPMDRDVLVNKFLTLGGSGKNHDGIATGGFGKAKEVLIGCHLEWDIRTGTLHAYGEGGSYSLDAAAEYDGTVTTVTMEGDEVEAIAKKFRHFAALAQWSGTLTLIVEGVSERLETSFRKGSPRREFAWGKVYTNRALEGVLVVRMGGQPMFYRNIRYKGCVLVELSGTSGERLVASRDRLQYSIANELDDLVTSLAIDTKSALRQQVAEYKRYQGKKLSAEKKAVAVEGLNVAAFIQSATQPKAAPRPNAGGIRVSAVSQETSTVSLGPEFIVKNTTGLKTPEHFLPGEQFSKSSKSLVKAWGASMKRLYELLEADGSFSIGFILDEENAAEAETSREYGLVYYLNPAVVVKQSASNARSLKTRYSSAWTHRFEILSLVVHEAVHGVYELSGHDETFAAKLTEVTAVVFENFKDFAQFFR